jgi:hypothetical protein
MWAAKWLAGQTNSFCAAAINSSRLPAKLVRLTKP